VKRGKGGGGGGGGGEKEKEKERRRREEGEGEERKNSSRSRMKRPAKDMFTLGHCDLYCIVLFCNYITPAIDMSTCAREVTNAYLHLSLLRGEEKVRRRSRRKGRRRSRIKRLITSRRRRFSQRGNIL